MKKNEPVKNKKTEERKNTVSDKNIPSEKIRFKDNEERELQFRKVLYGYDPDEVAAYINELEKTYESASKIQESKLSSLKEELVLSNRERNSYIEKFKKIQSKKDEITEYEATVSQLKETVEALKNENAKLRNIPAHDESNVKNSDAQKIHELEEIINRLQSENISLAQQADKYTSLEAEYNSVFMQFENAKSKLEAKEKELESKTEELAEKSNEIIELSAEIHEAKNKSAELEIKNNVLVQSETEKENEISALKEANKNMAFENVEKINAIENEHAKDKLAMQKELKLYGYYVDRAELTLAELTKQMAQIKQTLANTQN